MNIIGHRRIWYAISLIAIVPGIISLIAFRLQLGIDFKGGSVLTVQGRPSAGRVQEAAQGLGFKDISQATVGGAQQAIRYRDDKTGTAAEASHQTFRSKLEKAGFTEVSYDTVGGSVSRDITTNAFLSILVAALAIVLYIAYAFRNMPPPVSSWAFGLAAIAALLHDALFVLGVFSILGKVAGVEIDALFVTAVLTVIGFSVHDTIVVFDRIRENLRRQKGSFESIVNASILETLARSLNTSLTVVLTLLALFLFGGQSIKVFVLALLIGIISGTYSSIFNASPLLVSYHHYRVKKLANAPRK
jgi:preprotein translocase subunit SecF